MDAPIMGKTHRPPGKDLQPLLAAFAKNPVAALLRRIQDLAATVPAPTRGAPPDGSRESLPFALTFSATHMWKCSSPGTTAPPRVGAPNQVNIESTLTHRLTDTKTLSGPAALQRQGRESY